MAAMSSEEKPIHPFLKLVLEIGPLAVFFLCFQYGREILANPTVAGPLESIIGTKALQGDSGPVFVATAFFMVAITLSLSISWALTRSLPKMAVVTAIVVIIFGGLTLWLQDETFIKMKPTIVNGIFATILGFGLLQGRSYLKYLMGEAIPLTDRGWFIFTARWAMFFVFLGILNEVIWRTQTTEFWVSFKTFANLPLTVGFVALHWNFLQRHALETAEQKGD